MTHEENMTSGKSDGKQTNQRSWATKIKKVFQRKKTTSIKKEKMLRQTPEILPFLQIHNDYILLKNGVMDILQIQTKNIHALNDTDLNVLLLNRTRFLRSYFRSYKEIILNFQANTDTQRTYCLKNPKHTTSPNRLKYIDQILHDVDMIDRD